MNNDWHSYEPTPPDPTPVDAILNAMAAYISARPFGTNARIVAMIAEDLEDIHHLTHGDTDRQPGPPPRHQQPDLNPT